MNILVTGGAGYIGSHTVRELLAGNYRVVVYDNLTTGHLQAVSSTIPIVVGSLCNQDLLVRTMRKYEIDAIVHFARGAMGNFSKQASQYFNLNVVGTIDLLAAMRVCGVHKIVFSSSAAVYGDTCGVPVTEDTSPAPMNLNGRTKLIAERMLVDLSRNHGYSYVILRYYNAAGASLDGSIGEAHCPETHLIPQLFKVALGEQSVINVLGMDDAATDGTCSCEYVHVVDIAHAHVHALEYLHGGGEARIYNLGVGQGHSIRQIISKAEAITGVNIAMNAGMCRPDEIIRGTLSSEKIRTQLGWNPCYSDIDTIMNTAWNWHRQHPQGYGRSKRYVPKAMRHEVKNV